MSAIGYVNVSMETFGGLLSLVFLICLNITRRKREALEQLYIRMLVCNTALLFCDASAWLFKGRPDRFSFYAVRISNFLVFTLGYVILVFFTHYLVRFLMEKNAPVSKKTLYAMCSIMLVAVALTVVTQFNGMYYIIDSENIYHRQSMFWLSQVFGIAGLVLNGCLMVFYRKYLNIREIITFSIYILLPFLSLLFQMFFYSVAILYLATSICLIGIYLSIQLKVSQEAARREIELAESRINMMLSQIQPHFLYNTLAAIEYLCSRDGAGQAAKVVRDFSKYLHKNMDSLTLKCPIPFTSELEHAKLYLSIEQLQYEERLQVEFDIQATDFFLPALTLQPIVENAVKHGVSKREEGGRVTIRSYESETSWNIMVTDDGVGFDTLAYKEDKRQHIGIENVMRRLESMSGGSLLISSRPGDGTQVTLSIPKGGV